MSDAPILETEFNGLSSAQPSLPASWYFDPEHHARELREIWGSSWIYAGRAESLPEAGDCLSFDVCGQSLVVLRGDEGGLHGYFNTCHHRGAALCEAGAGKFDRRIVCPYHQWSYALDGCLLATGRMRAVAGFDRRDYGLHRIAVVVRSGYIFVNLAADSAEPFDSLFGDELRDIGGWPIADLVVGHRYEKTLACNWKIFWENYNECLHCPNIHPELSNLVPIYSRGLMTRKDDPEWPEFRDSEIPERSGRLRDGAETWSMDGTAQDELPGLTEEDRAAGQRYATLLPSAFIAAHVDYVRIVRLLPLTPETTALTAEWLFRPATLARPGFDLAKITDFATLVMEQDGQACELNQRGLKASAFQSGVLMQEEYEVFLFQQWVRAALGEAQLETQPASRASRRRP